MKALQQPVIKQSLIDEDAVILENINRVLKGQIKPISKTSDLTADQWFKIADILLIPDPRLSRHARQFGIDTAQAAAPLAAYLR